MPFKTMEKTVKIGTEAAPPKMSLVQGSSIPKATMVTERVGMAAHLGESRVCAKQRRLSSIGRSLNASMLE